MYNDFNFSSINERKLKKVGGLIEVEIELIRSEIEGWK